MEIGSYADWVGAIGTVGSLLIALWLLNKEMDDRRKREADTEAEQARSVSAWSELEGDRYTLTAKNTGDEPVFDVVVNLYAMVTDPPDSDGPEFTNGYKEWILGILPPGETMATTFHKLEIGGGYPAYEEVEIEFTDTSGRHWQRDKRGKIARIGDRSPRAVWG